MAAAKKTVLYVTGTRADFNLMRRVLEELARSDKLAPRLLVTGMHTLEKFGNTIDEVRESGLPIAEIVPVGESDSMAAALATELEGISDYCERERPDAIMLLGDRGEMLAGAIAGAHLRIPVIHLHGGDVSGEVDDAMRHAITKLAHVHFPATDKSAERIERLGEEPWRVRVAGAPGVDRLKHVSYKDRATLARELGLEAGRQWIAAILHPSQEGAIGATEQADRFFAALGRFPEAEKILIYPNSDTGYEPIVAAIEKLEGDPRVHAFKSLSGDAFANLMKEGAALVGNSSSGVIESGFFKLPTVNVGGRQADRERDMNVIDAAYDAEEIVGALQKALSAEFRNEIAGMASVYDKGDTAEIIKRNSEELLFGARDLLNKAPLYKEVI